MTRRLLARLEAFINAATRRYIDDTTKGVSMTKDTGAAEARRIAVRYWREAKELRTRVAALTAEAAESEAAWQRESDARDKDFADYTASLAELVAENETLTAQRDAANDEANRLRYDLNHPYGEVARSAPDEDVKP